MGLTLVTPPESLPLGLEEARDHLRIDAVDDTAEVSRLIATATAQVDGRYGWLRRCLITQTWDETFDSFPVGTAPIELHLPRLQSVTEIKYVDVDGNNQTWASSEYVVKTDVEPGRIHRAPGASWPSTGVQVDAVTVTFVAGFGDDWNAVPEDLRHALLIMIGELYKNREETVIGSAVNEVPMASQALMARYQVFGP